MRLSERIVNLARLDLEAQRGRGELLKINLADEKELARLRIHLEEASLVAQYDGVPQARIDSRVLVISHDGGLHSDLLSNTLALLLTFWLVCDADRWR